MMNTPQQKYTILHTYLAVIIGAVIIGGFIDLGANTISHTLKNNPNQNQPTTPTVIDTTTPPNPSEKVEPATVIDMNKIDLSKTPFKGKKDAPITIVSYNDFQCPFCGRFYTNVQKLLLKEYVDTGKAKFYYKNYAFLGIESEFAAQGLWCAHDQGKYWEYHDYIFDYQNKEDKEKLTKENLKNIIKSLKGINAQTFATCLDSDKYKEQVQKELEEGKSLGVNGTPQTFINGEVIPGAQDYTVFQNAIEKLQ